MEYSANQKGQKRQSLLDRVRIATKKPTVIPGFRTVYPTVFDPFFTVFTVYDVDAGAA
jgi:hypothetical protein